MSKPEITTQIRIQSETDFWFTVEDIYLDLGSDGLTISYWELRNGKEERCTHICVDGSLALIVADTIYKLFKEVDELEDQEDLRLVMERRNGPTTRLTLEELSMLPTTTQENN